MGFFSKITSLHKNAKKLSLAHVAIKKIGGKKADAIHQGIGTAAGDAFTGGLLSTGKKYAYGKAAQEKAKKQAKASKKKQLAAAKKGQHASAAIVPGGQTITLSAGAPRVLHAQPSTAFGQSKFGQALGSLDRILDNFAPQPEPAGGGFLPEFVDLPPSGPEQVDENGERSSLLPFVLIGGGLIVVAFLVKRS